MTVSSHASQNNLAPKSAAEENYADSPLTCAWWLKVMGVMRNIKHLLSPWAWPGDF